VRHASVLGAERRSHQNREYRDRDCAGAEISHRDCQGSLQKSRPGALNAEARDSVRVPEEGK